MRKTTMLSTENPEDRVKNIRKTRKRIVLIFLAALLLIFSVYNYLKTYTDIDYEDIEGGINIVETDTEIRFEVTTSGFYGYGGDADVISTDYENDIEYIKIYIYIYQTKYNLLFGKSRTSSLLALDTNGFEVGADAFTQSDEQGNVHEIRQCVAEVYYQIVHVDKDKLGTTRIGEPVLIWKFND